MLTPNLSADGSIGGAWPRRRWTAGALKAAVIAVPLVVSVLVSVAVSSAIPMPAELGGRILWWVAVLSSCTLVLIAGEALARRVLPLVGLLRLSLMFPGRAPSRVDLARRSSRKELEELSAQVREEGLGGDAEEAAIVLVRLVAALDAHDRRTRGHSERVRTYTDLLARRLHLGAEDANKLRWSALLHDIGKLSVPAEVLNKPGRLTAAEWDLIHEHPAAGDRMLGALREWLGPWAAVALEHHERWDGGGYPAGLVAEEISLGARLVAVADSYDVMTSIRSYQPQPRTPEGARNELVRCAGSQFDPGMVRCFLNISTRHLWWILGPITWLVQIPLVGRAAALAARRQLKIPALSQPVVSALVVIALTIGPTGLGANDPPPAFAAPARHHIAESAGPIRSTGPVSHRFGAGRDGSLHSYLTGAADGGARNGTVTSPMSPSTALVGRTTAAHVTAQPPTSRSGQPPGASQAAGPASSHATRPVAAPSTPTMPLAVPAPSGRPASAGGDCNGHAYANGHDHHNGQGQALGHTKPPGPGCSHHT